jgi:hypothetical protein
MMPFNHRISRPKTPSTLDQNEFSCLITLLVTICTLYLTMVILNALRTLVHIAICASSASFFIFTILIAASEFTKRYHDDVALYSAVAAGTTGRRGKQLKRRLAVLGNHPRHLVRWSILGHQTCVRSIITQFINSSKTTILRHTRANLNSPRLTGHKVCTLQRRLRSLTVLGNYPRHLVRWSLDSPRPTKILGHQTCVPQQLSVALEYFARFISSLNITLLRFSAPMPAADTSHDAGSDSEGSPSSKPSTSPLPSLSSLSEHLQNSPISYHKSYNLPKTQSKTQNKHQNSKPLRKRVYLHSIFVTVQSPLKMPNDPNTEIPITNLITNPIFRTVGVMPRPGQPGALHFDISDVSEFLRRWNLECEDFGLTDP